MIKNTQLLESSLDFCDLESRYGRDSAFQILRTLEEFEGVAAARVRRLSCEDRLKNVLSLMIENTRTQTCH